MNREIKFGMWLTGHDEQTIIQMYNDFFGAPKTEREKDNLSSGNKNEGASVVSLTCTVGKSIELLKEWFKPPFWYDAESGGYIFDNNGKTIVEVRGWGMFSVKVGDDKAWKIQNQIGELIAQLLNKLVSDERSVATMPNSSNSLCSKVPDQQINNSKEVDWEGLEKENEVLKMHLVNLLNGLKYFDGGVYSTEDNNLSYANAILYAKQLAQKQSY